MSPTIADAGSVLPKPYSIDPQYNTTTFISREDGFIDYEAPQSKVDLVEDNDDQDRVPGCLSRGLANSRIF